MIIQGSETITEGQLLLQFLNAQENPNCDSLELNDVDFDVNLVAALIDTLHSKSKWKSIKLQNCVGGAIVYDVLWAICTLPRLQTFELNHSVSSVGAPAFTAISHTLNYSKTIKHLTLRARTIDYDAGNNLARAVARNTWLETLDLGESVLSPSAIGNLSFGLRLNRTIHALKLDGCNLEDCHIATVLRALEHHPALKVLSISKNQCHDEGMSAIAALLHFNELEDLDMSYLIRKPKQTNNTAEIIEEEAKNSDDEDNDGTSSDAEDASNQDAVELKAETDETTTNVESDAKADDDDGDAKIEDEDTKSEETQKVSNTHLKRFAMAGNFLSDAFLESVLSIFGKDSSLQELNLFGNRITDHGVGLIIQKILQWKHLHTLWLGQNMFYPVAAERLLRVMEKNYTILDLNIRSFDSGSLDKIQNQLDHYCRLNRGGRRIMSAEKSTIPLSLWPLILERAQHVFSVQDDDGQNSTTSRIHPHSVDSLQCLLRGPPIFENPKIMETMV